MTLLPMDKFKHSYIEANGTRLHVAEIGSESSPAVVFLNGFPELWYTWRHQLIAVANAGFRAIAIDYRGYGLSDIPKDVESTTFSGMAADTASILDSLGIAKAYVVAKDFGSMVGYLFALYHPQKIIAIITFGLPYLPYGSHHTYLDLPEGFYFRRFREHARAKADFARFDNKTVVKKMYIMLAKSEIPIAPEDKEIMDLVDASEPLPPWFTEEDLEVYAQAYNKCGFETALQVPYRRLDDRNEYPESDDYQIESPALLVLPKDDYITKFPGMEEYVKSGAVKKYVPNLEVQPLDQGCHFIPEQFPEITNKVILDYLNRHKC